MTYYDIEDLAEEVVASRLTPGTYHLYYYGGDEHMIIYLNRNGRSLVDKINVDYRDNRVEIARRIREVCES